MTTTLTSKCPAGCGRAVSPGKLVCLPCWREIPKHLQREVYRTWRAYSKDSTDEAFAAYDAARTMALGAIA